MQTTVTPPAEHGSTHTVTTKDVTLPGTADTATPRHMTPPEITESAVRPVTAEDRERPGKISWATWGLNRLPTGRSQKDDAYKGRVWNMG